MYLRITVATFANVICSKIINIPIKILNGINYRYIEQCIIPQLKNVKVYLLSFSFCTEIYKISVY